MENLAYNMARLDSVNTVLFITVGVIAGILGLKGIYGFLFFGLASVIIGVAHLFAMKFNIRKYCNMSEFDFIIFGMKNHVMSFLLFWILVYALVHIYKA